MSATCQAEKRNTRRHGDSERTPRHNRTRTCPHTASADRSRTYATELLSRDVPSEVVQKLLGHASVSTTIDTYSHLEVRHVRAVLESVGWLPRENAGASLADGEVR